MRSLIFLLGVFIGSLSLNLQAKPDLMLLQSYKNQVVTGWAISEKYDGVRGYWTGKDLLTRAGNKINAPAWFTNQLPAFALDGELWTKRQDFENIVSIVRQVTPDDRWREIKFMVFDVPKAEGNLFERLAVLENYLLIHKVNHLQVIKQFYKPKNKTLEDLLEDYVAQGAEGLVIRDPLPPYLQGRTSIALKLKPKYDAECRVIEHHLGKGKYSAVMGSLSCLTQEGLIIKLGSGFSDKERQSPPEIGSWVTYQYYGLTKKGLPRHAVFLRERLDMNF